MHIFFHFDAILQNKFYHPLAYWLSVLFLPFHSLPQQDTGLTHNLKHTNMDQKERTKIGITPLIVPVVTLTAQVPRLTTTSQYA
jgi:hypothetical protein